MQRSVAEGRRVQLDQVDCSIDGLKVKRVGEKTLEIVSRMVDDIVTLPDPAIFDALLWTLARTEDRRRRRSCCPRRGAPERTRRGASGSPRRVRVERRQHQSRSATQPHLELSGAESGTPSRLTAARAYRPDGGLNALSSSSAASAASAASYTGLRLSRSTSIRPRSGNPYSSRSADSSSSRLVPERIDIQRGTRRRSLKLITCNSSLGSRADDRARAASRHHRQHPSPLTVTGQSERPGSRKRRGVLAGHDAANSLKVSPRSETWTATVSWHAHQNNVTSMPSDVL